MTAPLSEQESSPWFQEVEAQGQLFKYAFGDNGLKWTFGDLSVSDM